MPKAETFAYHLAFHTCFPASTILRSSLLAVSQIASVTVVASTFPFTSYLATLSHCTSVFGRSIRIVFIMYICVSEPSEYLAITGVGIPNIRITKKAFVLPFQKVQRISISPFDFSLNLQAMTVEKLQFSLPAVFTIGPEYELAALEKYAMLLSGENTKAKVKNAKTKNTVSGGRNHVQDIVKGIIEGETRVIVSGMTMEEIFKERHVFKQKVISNVQSELDQFGLKMYVGPQASP